MAIACGLPLEELVCLRLRDQAVIPQGPQEALALLHVSRTEIPRIMHEVVHQVVVFTSNAFFSHTFPCPSLPASGSLPEHLRFFLIVLCP